MSSKKLPCPHCKRDLFEEADAFDDAASYNASEMGHLDVGRLEWEHTITCECGESVKLSAQVRTTYHAAKVVPKAHG